MKVIVIALMVLFITQACDTDAITAQLSQLVQNSQTPLLVNLHLYGDEDCGCNKGGSKVFDKFAQKPEKIFAQTIWTIETINGKKVDLKVVVDGNSISFDYYGKMRFTYVITGNKIKIISQWTKIDLPIQPTPSQAQIQAAFLNSVNFDIVGDEFILKDINGNSLIEFAKQNSNPDLNIPLIDGSLDVNKLLPGKLPFRQIGYRPLAQDIEQIISKELKGNWKVTRVGNIDVSFDASISESRIQYKYCNYNSWLYFIETNGSFRAVEEKIPAMMNCTGLVPSEVDVDQLFRSIASFKLRGAQLHFFNTQGDLILIFNSRRFTPFVYPITQLWTTALVGDVGVSIVVNITDDFFQFTYTNEITMPYRISGNKIDIGLGWPGKLNTSEAKIYPSESHVLTAFTRARTYVFSDSNLVLFDEQNNVVVKFKAGQHSSYVQNIPSIKKVWKVTHTSNRAVCFYVNITDDTITYTYGRTKVFKYITKGNIIHLSPPIITSKHKSNYKPSSLQQLIDDSFMSATNFRLQTNLMYLLNKDFRDVVTLRYYKTLTLNKGTINPKKSKF